MPIVAAVAFGSALACSQDAAPLDEAIAIASSDGDFGNGPEAGESLARVAQFLDEAIDECDVTVNGARCAALRVASGYAQVLAVRVLQCTAPGRFEARTGMLELLEAVDEIAPEADDTPEPAPLPDCT